MRLTMGMKKVVSLVLAGAMVIAGANVNATSASAEETEAVASIASDAGNWGGDVETSVDATVDKAATEAKTYTVSKTYKSAVSVSDYLAVRIEGLDSVSGTVEFSDVSVWVDGKGVEVKPNYGGDGDCRIELVNNWGKTPNDGAFNGNSFTKIEVQFTLKFLAEAVTREENTAISTAEVTDKEDAAVKATIASDAGNWGGDVETSVDAAIDKAATEAKTYTVSKTYKNPVVVSDYLAVRIEDLDSVAGTVEFSDVSVWINGHAIEVTANYGGDGDCRIELVNNWGKTPIVDSLKGVYFDKIEVQFTVKFLAEPVTREENAAITTVLAADKEDATDLPVVGGDEPTQPEPSDTESVWTKAGAHAYIAYQMAGTWDYRNMYEPGKTHADATSYDYIKAGDDVTYTAKVSDALLTEDGEYTISISGIDLSASDSFNILAVSTDIERAEYPDLEITNATVKIDGKAVTGLENIVLPYKNATDDKYYTFAIADTYTDWKLTGDAPFFGDNHLEVIPSDSIEITFTIKGLANQVPNEPVGLSKGKQFTKGNLVYKVTKQAKTRTNGAVTVVGLSKAGKKAKSVSVAATVKNTGTYKVTAIDKNAFKGAAATSITLNKNIKSIPASAFANCKKLTKLTLNAKLTGVKTNAFKGCKKTITVKGTAKKKNVKTLKKSGYKNFK